MSEPTRGHRLVECAESLEQKAERLTRLEAIDCLFPLPRGTGGPEDVLPLVARILRDGVRADVVSIEFCADPPGPDPPGPDPPGPDPPGTDPPRRPGRA